MPKSDLSVAHFKEKGTAWWTREDGTPHDAFVLANLGKKRSGHLLEIGSGRGAITFKLRDAGWEVAAIDVNREFIVHCKRKKDCSKIEFIHETADFLPFRDGVFDSVVSVEVLMHLSDPPRALKEMSRVLRPGGRVILTFLKKYSYDHIKKSISVAMGHYERKYGRGSVDFRYDSIKDIERYIKDTGLSIQATSNQYKDNPCIVLRKGDGGQGPASRYAK